MYGFLPHQQWLPMATTAPRTVTHDDAVGHERTRGPLHRFWRGWMTPSILSGIRAAHVDVWIRWVLLVLEPTLAKSKYSRRGGKASFVPAPHPYVAGEKIGRPGHIILARFATLLPRVLQVLTPPNTGVAIGVRFLHSVTLALLQNRRRRGGAPRLAIRPKPFDLRRAAIFISNRSQRSLRPSSRKSSLNQALYIFRVRVVCFLHRWRQAAL